LFEVCARVGMEEGVGFGVVVFGEEEVPLAHGFVGEVIEGGRVEPEFEALSGVGGTLTIFI
jgi:hypothetical protein